MVRFSNGKIFNSSKYKSINCVKPEYLLDDIISMAIVDNSMIIFTKFNHFIIYDDISSYDNLNQSIDLSNGRFYSNIHSLLYQSKYLNYMENFTKNLNLANLTFYLALGIFQSKQNIVFHFYFNVRQFLQLQEYKKYFNKIQSFTIWTANDYLEYHFYGIKVPLIANQFIRTINLGSRALLVVFFYENDYVYLKTFKDNSGLMLDLIGYICQNRSNTMFVTMEPCGIKITEPLSILFNAAFLYHNKIHFLYADSMIMYSVNETLFQSFAVLPYDIINLKKFFVCTNFTNNTDNVIIIGPSNITIVEKLYRYNKRMDKKWVLIIIFSIKMGIVGLFISLK